MRLKEVAPKKTRYAQDLATEKGSMWLTSLLLKEMRFNQKKRELKDGLSLCYDWPRFHLHVFVESPSQKVTP